LDENSAGAGKTLKYKNQRKKLKGSLCKIRHASHRKSMYEGDILIEGIMKKETSNGMTKR
jgi:hypothetical protein